MYYNPAACAEDRATVESNRSADTRPKTGQGEQRSALFVPAQFLAKSEKLKARPLGALVMGRSLLKGFAVEVEAISTPGVVGSRGFRGLDLVIEGFGIDHFGLALGHVVDGVG